MEMISDNDSAARCDAIRMITGLKDGRLLYPIIKSLQDDDLGVQQAAMDALLCYDDEAAVYNLIPLIADQRVAVKNLAQEILEKIGGSGLRLLHAHIHDRDEDVRKMIADIIGRLELPEAAPVLIEMLNDPNDNVKCSAMEGLGRITDQSIVEHLIALLGQGGWITLFAVESLGRLKNSRAVQPLVKLLNSSQSIDVQYMAIDSLSNIGGKESIAGLLEIIDFVKPEIMDIAVMGIVTMTQGNVGSVVDEFGREAFIVHLARAADNVNVSDQEDILNILQAFMSIGSSECAEEVLKLIEGIDRENQVLLNKAVEVMKETADENTLIDLLSHINQTVKLVSIRVLGLIRSGKAIPALSILFEEVERDLKKEILAAMGNIGGQNALRFISERLSCGDGHIRKSAVNALGSLASTEAIKPLLNQLHKEEYRDVIGTVVCALIEIGRRNKSQELAEGLLISLNSEKSAVREMVVRGLGELKWIDSSEHICGLLNDEDWRVRRACLEVLSCLSNTGFIENLIIAAHDEKDEVRMTVAQLLSENTDVSTATDVLIEMLEDNNDRIQLMAIEGLVRQNTPKAIPFIMRLAGSANYTVRKYSLWALGELGAYEAEHILRIAASDEDQEIHDAAIAAYNKLMSSKYVNH
ncbi:MAG: hypothetical protein A2W23_04095 [Planctomycetes bacterium RBG_16_43_13]|nr:MAG: hypothetical protein A2W23_04095 [Planctomycetes bacterium RBG_16_43_13]